MNSRPPRIVVGGIKEIYYSNGGELNLDTNMVTPNGGLTENHVSDMAMKPNLLEETALAEQVKLQQALTRVLII